MQQTLEEIVSMEMETPIIVTDRKTQAKIEMLPLRAMFLAVKNKAMNGDIASFQFIMSLMGNQQTETEEQARQREERRRRAEEDIRREFEAEGLRLAETDVEMLASQLLTIRRLAALLELPSHQDTDERPQRDGSRSVQLSPLNKIYQDALKAYRQDRDNIRKEVRQAAIMKKQLGK